MSNIIRKTLAVAFLLATAVTGEEFFRHMAHEDDIQQAVRASKPYTSERGNLINKREHERGLAGLAFAGGVASLILAGVSVPGKNTPKAAPG